MVKKQLKLLTGVILSVCIITGCGKSNPRSIITTTELFTTEEVSVTSEEDSETETEETTRITTEEVIIYPDTGIPTVEIGEDDYISDPDESVDYDLTALSPNMVYAQVYNIIIKPDEYIGKTIKIRGPYKPLYYENTKNYYHYIIIKDAQACCESGMEFIWDDNAHIYPDDYPEEGTEIEIVGTILGYTEEDYNYYYVNTDEIKICE